VSTPIPYQLDILGGLQFENLVQGLLSADLGLGVEAWGGSADHGTDAYSASELNFPNKRVTNPGPFVFQVKFISGANSTGARFEKDLYSAIRKEAELILRRIEVKRWKPPKHYCLLSNAPITAAQRTTAANILKEALPEATITIQGALGICGLLDRNISVARAFPQILSLRSLTDLLKKVVRHRSIQRSEAAIKEAEGVTQVFVPTEAYDQAWQVLNKHNFVVLEGPPEMGKTAIAWMIAAVQLAQKWEVIDCDSPDDFFEGYEPDDKQVFVADDAFGTTEYEIIRGNNWGRQLHKILPKLNPKHWLIWTSRGNILKKALHEMSLQGKATKFPKPAEVIVNAAEITQQERALMLYRHAKAAGLDAAAKDIVRGNVDVMIESSHFTPERVKRFVADELPDLADRLARKKISHKDLSARIVSAIENPTVRMEKAFAKLDPDEKWLLIALLDCERDPDPSNLESSYRRFREVNRPIETQIQLLEEGFLQKSSDLGFPQVSWIHPSYRDLVIGELKKDEAAAAHFLKNCSLTGVQLALSVAGGATGERRFPLMTPPESWTILKDRALQLIAEDEYGSTIDTLLETTRLALTSANADTPNVEEITNLLYECCRAAKTQLERLARPIEPSILKEFYKATMVLMPPPPMPSLFASLQGVEDDYAKAVRVGGDNSLIDVGAIEDWATAVGIVAKTDPRLLIQRGFPDDYAARIEALCSAANTEASQELSSSDEDDYYKEMGRMRDLSNALDEIIGLIPRLDGKIRRTLKLTRKQASAAERKFFEKSSHSDPGDEPSKEARRILNFDLDRLFADL
jgi:hypothetical protein